jgi:hypothetical protein
MTVFGGQLKAENPFLGFHGDFQEGAASCYKTAGLFAVIGVLSCVSFGVTAVRQKLNAGYGAPAARPGGFAAV